MTQKINETERKRAMDANWDALIANNVKIQQAEPHLIYDVGFELGYSDGFKAGRAASEEWVETSERLPESYNRYIVCLANGSIFTAEYSNLTDRWMIFPDGPFPENPIIAWRDLPSPFAPTKDEG